MCNCGNAMTFYFPGWTLPGCNLAGHRSSSAGSKWSACSASAGGQWSDLLLAKFRSVGRCHLLIGDWPTGFYASSEPLRQPASGLTMKINIFISVCIKDDCSDGNGRMLKTTTIALKTMTIGILTTDLMTILLTEIKRKFMWQQY